MKKILLILVMFIYSCAGVNPSILNPLNDPLSKKLHKLQIGLGSGSVIRTESVKTVTVQTDFATIFSRELETNVFDNSRKNVGYIEYKIVFDSYNLQPISFLLYGLHGITAFFPTLLGLPVESRKRTLEAEISIYDIEEVQLKKYIISSTSDASWVTLYNQSSAWSPRRKAGVQVTKEIINQFKSQLLEDIDFLNKELEGQNSNSE
jgi:hypothetical protein